MTKRTREEIDDMKHYANSKGLHPDFGIHCHTKDQIDIVLYIWNEMKGNWWQYHYFKDTDKNRIEYKNTYTQHTKAEKHLEWLEEYYINIDSPDRHVVKKLIQTLKIPTARKSKFINDYKEMADKHLDENKFSKNQKSKIIALLIRDFKTLEDVPFKVYNPLQ